MRAYEEHTGAYAHVLGNDVKSPLQLLGPLPPNDFTEMSAPLDGFSISPYLRRAPSTQDTCLLAPDHAATQQPAYLPRDCPSPSRPLGLPSPNKFLDPVPLSGFPNTPRIHYGPLQNSACLSASDCSALERPGHLPGDCPPTSQIPAGTFQAMTANVVALNQQAEVAHKRMASIESLAAGLFSEVRGNAVMIKTMAEEVAKMRDDLTNYQQKGIKITATSRPISASKLLSQLIYNGTQTASGFVCLLCYSMSRTGKEVVVVSVLSVALLCLRVGLPSTCRAVSATLSTLGFTTGSDFTDSEYYDLLDIFCLHDVKTKKTLRKRFLSMPSDNFFNLLENLEVPPVVRIREKFGKKFKTHDLSNDAQAFLPSIGAAFWSELYEIWGDSFDKYITRARERLNLDPLPRNKRSNIHGIEPSAGRVLSYEQAKQAKQARTRSRRR